VLVVGLLLVGLAFTNRFEGGVAAGPTLLSTTIVTSTTSSVASTTSTSYQSSSYSSTETSTASHSSIQTSSTSTSVTSGGTSTTVHTNTLVSSCFTQKLKLSSEYTLTMNETTVNVFWLVNSKGTNVVIYGFQSRNMSLTSGQSLSYSFTLAPNSTFTGAGINATFTGSEPILGFAGPSGSPATFGASPKGPPNQIVIAYTFPEGSAYIVGVTNAYNGTQNVSIDSLLAGTCGDSWLSGVSVG
jgi:hypothetical protein